VEWHALTTRLGLTRLGPRNGYEQKCPFLVYENAEAQTADEGYCGIYEARPLICRVHGLPLSYPLEEYNIHGKKIDHDPPVRHIIWCDLNFTGVDRFEPPFSHDSVFDMVWMQELLDELNNNFLESPEGAAYIPGQPLSLRRMSKLSRG
jgi:hypothetical protein